MAMLGIKPTELDAATLNWIDQFPPPTVGYLSRRQGHPQLPKTFTYIANTAGSTKESMNRSAIRTFRTMGCNLLEEAMWLGQVSTLLPNLAAIQSAFRTSD